MSVFWAAIAIYVFGFIVTFKSKNTFHILQPLLWPFLVGPWFASEIKRISKLFEYKK